MNQTKWAVLLAIGAALLIAVTAGVIRADQPPPPADPLGPLGLEDGPMGPGPGNGPEMGPGPGGAPGRRGRRDPGPGLGQGMDRNDRRKEKLEQIKRDDPERYQRLMRIRELALEYRNTADDKRKKEIEKELRPLVDKELRVQQEENKKRVEFMEKRLEEMKKVLKQREDHWNEVVDYTVKEITGQNDYLHAWPGGGHGQGPGPRPGAGPGKGPKRGGPKR